MGAEMNFKEMAELAVLLLGVGALSGLLVGAVLVWIGRQWLPDVPFRIPLWALITAMATAAVTGLGFSWLPAKRASGLQPVEALQKP